MPAEQRTNFFITSNLTDQLWDNRDFLNELVNLQSRIKYLSIGRHRGESRGYEHVHINLELTAKMTFAAVKRWFQVPEGAQFNIQKRMGTRVEANDYLAKEGPGRFRVIKDAPTPAPGKRNDIEIFDQGVRDGKSWGELKELCPNYTGRCANAAYKRYLEFHEQCNKRIREVARVKVILYLGPSGAGKTWHCITHPAYAEEGEDEEGKYWDPKSTSRQLMAPAGRVWFDGVDASTRTLFVDEFTGNIPFGYWCQLVNGTSKPRVEYKGGSFVLNITTWLFTSILHPRHWWDCRSLKADEHQLWRRITEIYWVERPNENGEYSTPELLDKEFVEHMTDEEFEGWMKYGKNKWQELYN